MPPSPSPSPAPSPSQFAALARSSPWRWRNIRFTGAWHGRQRAEPVRAWVRRPDCLRVEDLSGTVRYSGREAAGRTVSYATGGRAAAQELPAATALEPERDQDGLVLRRPPRLQHRDDPMYQSYHWVAMLDPAELADGDMEYPDEPAPPPLEIDELREVLHHDRPTWEAVVRTMERYDPRCGCCPLLLSADSEAAEAAAGGPTLREREPQLQYADAYRVRLDIATGVCVLTEEIGGTYAGTGHELHIEAVDEHMPDELFAPRPRSRWWRRFTGPSRRRPRPGRYPG